FVPDPGKGPVTAEDNIIGVLLPCPLFRGTRIEFGLGKVDVPYLFAKTELRPLLLGQIDHFPVENPPGNGPNGLPLLPVVLEIDRGPTDVHGPFVHGNGNPLDLVLQADLFQGRPAPIAHGQVDRAPGECHGPDIGPPIEDCDPMSFFSENDCQERTHQSGTYDGYIFGSLCHNSPWGAIEVKNQKYGNLPDLRPRGPGHGPLWTLPGLKYYLTAPCHPYRGHPAYI